MIKEVKVEENKQNGLFLVEVEVEPAGDVGVKERLRTPDIKRYLKKLDYKIGEVVQRNSLTNDSPPYKATWIFEKLGKKNLDKPVKTVVSSRRAKKVKKPSSVQKDDA
jgi:hypothetical protein